MHRPGEVVELLPQRFTVAKLLQAVCFEPLVGQLNHLQEKAQVAATRGRLRRGPLEDLNDRFGLLVEAERRQHQQQLGRIGTGIIIARTGVRRDEEPFSALGHFGQQPGMPSLVLTRLVERRFFQIDLVGELKLLAFGQGPDRPAHGRQGFDHPLQKLGIEFLRLHFLFGERCDFVDDPANLLLRMFNSLRIYRGGFRTHGCSTCVKGGDDLFGSGRSFIAVRPCAMGECNRHGWYR